MEAAKVAAEAALIMGHIKLFMIKPPINIFFSNGMKKIINGKIPPVMKLI